jgi:hypothetical protein
MGIFSAILDKLRHHGSASAAQTPPKQQTSTTQQPGFSGSAQQPGLAGSASQQPNQPSGQTAPQGQGSAQQPLQNVDVDAVLSQLAAKKGGGGNYRESIVDLLKLLDLDSSVSARKELANELNVHAGTDGSAEQNMALHKAFMLNIAEIGLKGPHSMLHFFNR